MSARHNVLLWQQEVVERAALVTLEIEGMLERGNAARNTLRALDSLAQECRKLTEVRRQATSRSAGRRGGAK